jgi:predicted DNA-binding transcriptional regulator AlpA
MTRLAGATTPLPQDADDRALTAIEEPLLIGRQRLSVLLDVGRRTVTRMNAAGLLPRPVRVSGSVRWRLDEIRAWVAAGCPTRKEWERGKYP